jgi:geranylgeranyl transferase type-2 subunit beta
LTLDFLAVHDALLAQGAASFSPEFRRRQAASVMSFRCADGGFRGRAGDSDPYYTDFACRTLRLLGDGSTALQGAAYYVLNLATPPKDVIDVFCRLNVLRLAGMLEDGATSVYRETLTRMSLAAAKPDQELLDAYQTFLACLCRGILGEAVTVDVGRLPALQDAREDARAPGGPQFQTSTTAAAAAVLLMSGAMTPAQAESIGAFLAHMQAEDGGFLAHPAAPHSDLLSTYTAFVTLAMLGFEDDADAVALARFLKGTALPEGGFRSCALDTDTDVEYTFYGVAAMALLHAKLA